MCRTGWYIGKPKWLWHKLVYAQSISHEGANSMRESGILMHITSLPGPYGIGTMGRPSFSFVDFLKISGQRCWQILPLNLTGFGDSPYQSCSAFAGNHYIIDLVELIEEGLLLQQEVDAACSVDRDDRVDFGRLYENRLDILRVAYSRFVNDTELDRFCRENSGWLSDFALYMALKDLNKGAPWYCWNQAVKMREPDAIWQCRQDLKDEIRFYCFVQYIFYRQWNDLRNYAHENGVRIIGDVPIYVPYDSVDVWSNPELFLLDDQMCPTAVAGVPPDGFSADGQLWGNPLYRWDVLRQDGYNWWIRRLESAGKLYDVIRLDHFRGFESYWSVPYGDETARNGCWIKGPGMDFIHEVKQKLPNISMIAEDLGYLTQEVFQLRQDSGFPGMKVLEFAFDSEEPSAYLPHFYTKNTVCYTGTHDNMTCRQWLDTASAATVDYATEYMRLTEEEGKVWGVIRTAHASVSDLCIVQMQDYLDLGAEGRMNFPGTMSGNNWTWRADQGFTNPALADKIYHMTKLYCRLGG